MTMPTRASEELSSQTTGSGCLTRLSWFVLGNMVLIGSALAISEHTERFLSVADAIFWLAVLAMIGLRYLDVTRMHGTTVTGQPASLTHWKRYAVALVGVALLLWALAHLWAGDI